jgi:nucleoid-associated protein YgaU
MGMFSFLENAGKKLFHHGEDNAEAIKKEIESSFTELPVDGLVVSVDDDTVTLAGVAKDVATREKAILIAGNVEGVSKVDADQLVSPEIIAAENTRDLPEPVFYNIQKGDTLWGISEDFYKDGSKYPLIVKANLEVIKDADKIYPGQGIRIPELLA